MEDLLHGSTIQSKRNQCTDMGRAGIKLQYQYDLNGQRGTPLNIFTSKFIVTNKCIGSLVTIKKSNYLLNIFICFYVLTIHCGLLYLIKPIALLIENMCNFNRPVHKRMCQ